jgi:hypothetical protein
MKRTLLLLSITLVTLGTLHAQDSTAKKELAGKYKFPDGSVVPEVEVVIDNGVLMMNSSAGTSSLELVKGDTFSIVAFNGTAVFKRNDAKKVIGVHIDAGGYVLDGVKDSSTTSKFAIVTMNKKQVVVIVNNTLQEETYTYISNREILRNFQRRRVVCLTE